jgi:tryptophan synthase alpha chain
MGYETFAAAAADAGVDGVLTVDMPPEEAAGLAASLRARGLDPIFLLAPTSNDERIRLIARQASGFVYYVSLKGVTGSSRLDIDAVAGKVDAIRAATDVPVGVGFGIGDAESAARVAAIADAVVVGSALVRRVEEHAADPARINESVASLLAEMRRAMDAA